MKKDKFRKLILNEGQALLIVLLSMSVILSVVLSVVSRSITDISVSTYEEEALRAFSAAEAGIEKALVEQTSVAEQQISTGSADKFKADIVTEAHGKIFNFPQPVKSGETATFWFVSHDSGFNLACPGGAGCLKATFLNVCFGNSPAINDQTPALELSIYYDLTGVLGSVATPNNFSNLQIARTVLDPNSARIVSAGTNFVHANDGVCNLNSEKYSFSERVKLNPAGLLPSTCSSEGCILAVKIRSLYNIATPHSIGLEAQSTGGTEFPPQGIQIESTGTSGESTRKIDVLQTYPEPPSFFETALFSRGDIDKVIP